MLAIVNVTPEHHRGKDQYEVRINRRVIARFEHERAYNGAAQCLRDAAEAVEKQGVDDHKSLLESLLPTFKRMQEREGKL